MTLSARYNTAGKLYYPYEVAGNRATRTGRDGSMSDYSFPQLVPQGYEIKGEKVKSDHHRPTDWLREIVAVVQDDPVIYTDAFLEGDGSTRESWLSYVHLSSITGDPSFWLYPGNFKETMDNLTAKLGVKLRNKLAGEKQFQTGAALAEARQTVNLLADTAGTFWRSALAVKRLQLRQAGRILGSGFGLSPSELRNSFGKKAAGKYLEVQYGWLPLQKDVVSLWEKLNEGKDTPYPVDVKGREQVHLETHPDPTRTEIWDGALYGRVVANVTSEALSNLNSWGLTNPLVPAWEVLPFSFIVDWFVPVGNFLSAVSATAGLEFDYGFISDTRQGMSHLVGYHQDGESWGVRRTVHDRGSYAVERYVFRRSKLYGFPSVALYAKDNPFSTQHVANALALFRQVMA